MSYYFSVGQSDSDKELLNVSPFRRAMDIQKIYAWLMSNRIRKEILRKLTQPMTATQLSEKARIPFGRCLWQVHNLVRKGILEPLIQDSHVKVYWLTDLGKNCQRLLYEERSLPAPSHSIPDLNWDFYSWASHRHRAPIVKILTKPMRPVQIRKLLRDRQPLLRISIDNVWDELQLMVKKGIVRAVSMPGSRFWFYELSSVGRTLQRLFHGLDV